MKKYLLIMFIICGLVLASVLPITGYMALNVPIQTNNNVKLENSISDANMENTEVKLIDESNDAIEIVTPELIPASGNVIEETEINIVDGTSLKESFAFHSKRIINQELTFMIIDLRDNVTYYLDYEELEKDVVDTDNYKKEFLLNENGELVKYTYTRVK